MKFNTYRMKLILLIFPASFETIFCTINHKLPLILLGQCRQVRSSSPRRSLYRRWKLCPSGSSGPRLFLHRGWKLEIVKEELCCLSEETFAKKIVPSSTLLSLTNAHAIRGRPTLNWRCRAFSEWVGPRNVRQLASRTISPGLLAPELETTSPQLKDD